MLHRRTTRLVLAKPIERHTAALDENGFVDWLVDAKPGDKIAYYRGHLTYDRTPRANVMDSRSRAVVHAVANRVMATAAKGLVLPVQKRIGPEDYLYIAVKALPSRAAARRHETTPPLLISSELSVVNRVTPALTPLAA